MCLCLGQVGFPTSPATEGSQSIRSERRSPPRGSASHGAETARLPGLAGPRDETGGDTHAPVSGTSG